MRAVVSGGRRRCRNTCTVIAQTHGTEGCCAAARLPSYTTDGTAAAAQRLLRCPHPATARSDTYYIAHVKDACAFLGDGMSRISQLEEQVWAACACSTCIGLPWAPAFSSTCFLQQHRKQWAPEELAVGT